MSAGRWIACVLAVASEATAGDVSFQATAAPAQGEARAARAESQSEAQGGAPAMANGPATGLAEVRVTARRREERLLEVPDSITVLDAASLQNARIETVQGVASRVPNFSIVDAQQPGVAHINVRGVGQTRNSEPPVAVVIDGVQLSHAYEITQSLFDIERIEVLKGPQGAVYGRNALGGAINITTRAPSNELEGLVRARAGTHSDFSGGATLSGAVVPDKLLFRLGLQGRSYDGDVASPNTPGRSRANALDEKGGRLTLLAEPSENTTVDLRLSHLETEAGAPWYTPVPPGGSPDEARPFAGDFPSHARRVLNHGALKATVLGNGLELASVTSFSRIRSLVETEADFAPADLNTAEQRLHAEHWSQELRVTSAGESAFHWLGGVYYLNSHQRHDTEVFLGRDFLPLMGLPPDLAPFLAATARVTDSNDAYAGFGQASYRWPAGLELTLALRYDEDRRHQLDRGTPSPQVYEATFSSWQPKASLSWLPTPASMVYATVGKGFRSGGFNPQERITRVYGAETNVSREVGTKLSMLDNRVNVTAAVFHTRIDDRQVYTLDVQTSAQTLSNPIPRSTVRGAEIEVTTRPVSALELSAAVGLARSRIDRYDTSVLAGLPVAGDFTGNSLPQTPEWSWTVSSQYRMPLAHGIQLIPRVEWYGQAGDFYWEIDNVNRRRAQSFVNVRLMAERAAWRFSAYVENVTNEQYVLEYLPARWSGTAAGDIAAAGLRRHGGVEVSYRF